MENPARRTERPRPVEIIRPATNRRDFPNREAQRLLDRKERRYWAPVAYTVFALAILTISSVAYSTYAFSRYRGVILPGVYVDQTSLGGMTPSKANGVIMQKLASHYFRPIELTYGQHKWDPKPIEIGMSSATGYDVKGTVTQAMNVGRKGPFVQQLYDRLPFHQVHSIPLLYHIDEAKLVQYIQRQIRPHVFRATINANLKIDQSHHVVLVRSRGGQVLNVAATVQAVKDALGSLSKVIQPVAVTQIQPVISDNYALGIRSRVESFLAHTPVIAIRKHVFVTTRDVIAPMLTFRRQPQVGKKQASIVLQVNSNAVRAYVAQLAAQIDRKPVDARMAFSAGKVQLISPQKLGRTLDQATATHKLLGVVSALKPNARLHFRVTVAKPPIDLSNPASLGINTWLATGATSFVGAGDTRLNDITNIAARLNDDLIARKQDVSFNTLVGVGWPDRVYQDQETESGGQLVPGDGGAMQQVATTFLRAMYGAGLKLVERHSHIYRLPWYEPPVGLDAIVSPADNEDLVFHNDTGKYLLIEARVEPIRQELYIYVYGPKLGWKVSVDKLGKIVKTYRHGPTITKQDPSLSPGQVHQVAWAHAGADTVEERTITYPNGNVTVDRITSHYQPWQAVVDVGAPVATPKPKPTATAAAQASPTPGTSTTPGPKPTPTFNH